MTQEEKETKQYVTKESLRKNLWRVMGVRNDFFAHMLFNFLSDRAGDDVTVNYFMFLKRLMPLWPNKPEEARPNENKIQLKMRQEKLE